MAIQINEQNTVDVKKTTWQPVIRINGMAFPVGGGSSMDFYKCAAVYGPLKVECYVISGCPTSEVNGTYIQTEFTTEDWEGNKQPVYSNGTYYYYYEPNDYMEWGISTDYTGYLTYRGGVGSSWSDSDWNEVTGMSCAESTTMVDTDVPKTWDGYKAVLSGGVYTFESEVTDGLTYTDVKPEILKIYSADASMRIAQLPLDYPTDGLVFHAPLTGDITATAVGSEITNKGVTAGAEAAEFNGSSVLLPQKRIGIKTGDDKEFTLFFCVNVNSLGYDGRSWIMMLGSGGAYRFDPRVDDEGGQNYLYFSANGNVMLSLPITFGAWYVITAVRRNKDYFIYNGKTLVGSYDCDWGITDPVFRIGADNDTGNKGLDGSMKNVLIYDRALSDAEIGQLVDKFGA